MPGSERALDLAILDDHFPCTLSSFRVAEYHEFFRRFPNSRLFSTRPNFDQELKAYHKLYPEFEGYVLPFDQLSGFDVRIAYTLFLNNIFGFLPLLENRRVPFAFTLNPGGGFHMGEAASDLKLKAVFSSPMFRHVVVTQKLTWAYLRRFRLCPDDKVTFVFGGVVPKLIVDRPSRFPLHKPVVDVCFVAHKYDPQGRDKGYDIFADVARRLGPSQEYRFHVVGGFRAGDQAFSADIPVQFHGHLSTHQFPSFYGKMDIIVSPNRPSPLYPGAFDGFPTGCCIEAGLCEVVLIATDPFRMQPPWPADSVLGTEPDAAQISACIASLAACPEHLRLRRHAIRKAFRRAFDTEAQMAPRAQVIRRYQPAARDSATEHISHWDGVSSHSYLL